MSNFKRLQDAFMKADALAQKGDEQAKKDATAFAQEIRRLQSSQPEETGAFLDPYTGQMNKAIAESIGGIVDFLNPLDNLGVTGSAVTGLKNLMQSSGVIPVSEREPEGFVEDLFAGTGSAASAAMPIAKGAQLLQKTPGLVGELATRFAPQLATTTGFGAELAAGGAASVASGEAERRGYSKPVQDIAGIVGGISPAAVVPAVRGARDLTKAAMETGPLKYLPTNLAYKAATKAIAPFTKAGAREIARKRVRELAGGTERAKQVAERISPRGSELGLTPAEQTGEVKLLQLQRAAMQKDPKVAESIAKKQFEAEASAREAFDVGGNIEDAQTFIAQRQASFASTLDEYVNAARLSAKSKIPDVEMDPIAASTVVAKELRRAEEVAKANQKMLWGKIPQDFEIDISGIKSTIKSLSENATRIGKDNIPQDASNFLRANELKNADRVDEINSLYTSMRDAARNAVSGDKVNRDQARVANAIADSILADFDKIIPDSSVNKKIVEARTFSRQMHDKFSRGEVGKLLKRTVRGEPAIRPELTLQKTIGAGGDVGMLAERDISRATSSIPEIGEATNATANYLRNIFNEKVFTGDKFSPIDAESFLKSNRTLLEKFPNVRQEIEQSILSQKKVADVTSRVSGLSKPVRESTSARFASAAPKKALDAVITAQDPKKAMANLIASAKKDKTGAALGGLKRAVTETLLTRSTKVLDVVSEAGATSELRGTRLSEALDDEILGGIAKQALSKGEMSRLRIISKELEKLDKARLLESTGDTMSLFKPNAIISIGARVLAARYGAQYGGNLGGSLQTANIFAARAQKILESLTNNKAMKLLIDATQDGELMRSLLLDLNRPENLLRLEKSLAPYVAGSISGSELLEDQDTSMSAQ